MDSQEKTKKARLTKRIKRNIAAISAIIVIIVGAASYTLFIKPLQNVETWEYVEYIVEQGTLQNIVTESGSVQFGITTQLYDLDVSTDSDDDDDDDDEEDDEKYLNSHRTALIPCARH